MKLGIVGLSNISKNTLFNSLTKVDVESASYPFCTIDPNVGMVPAPDGRLKLPGDLYHSKKITPAAIEFVDTADLIRGAPKGEGLDNQLSSNIREVSTIVHVVRRFKDANVIHVDSSVDPLCDIEAIDLELISSDIGISDRRITKTAKAANNNKSLAKEPVVLKSTKARLKDGRLARSFESNDEGVIALISSLNLPTWKPIIFVANIGEDDLADDGEGDPYV